MLKWIVFDFGGTLYDQKAVNRELTKSNVRSKLLQNYGVRLSEGRILDISEDVRNSMRGRVERHDPKTLFKKIGVVVGKKFTQKQLLEMESLYENEKLKRFKLVRGVEEVLKHAQKKNLNQAIISNAGLSLSKYIDKLDVLKKYFKIIISSAEIGEEKISLFPFMVFLARANKFVETKPEEVLMVGDRIDEDVAAAILGMRTVLIEGWTSGFKKTHGLQPTYKIKKLEELKKIIDELT